MRIPVLDPGFVNCWCVLFFTLSTGIAWRYTPLYPSGDPFRKLNEDHLQTQIDIDSNWLSSNFPPPKSTTIIGFIVVPSFPPPRFLNPENPGQTWLDREEGPAPDVIFRHFQWVPRRCGLPIPPKSLCYPKDLNGINRNGNVFLLLDFQHFEGHMIRREVEVDESYRRYLKVKVRRLFHWRADFFARSRSFAMLWWTRNKVERRISMVFGLSN